MVRQANMLLYLVATQYTLLATKIMCRLIVAGELLNFCASLVTKTIKLTTLLSKISNYFCKVKLIRTSKIELLAAARLIVSDKEY